MPYNEIDGWLEAAYEERNEAMFFEEPYEEEEYYYCPHCEDFGCRLCAYEDDYEDDEAGLS